MSTSVAPAPTELSGSLAELPLDRVLRFLAAGGREGTVTVTGPGALELVVGSDALAVAVGPDDRPGLVEAVLRSVLVGDGDFAYRPGDGPDPGSGWPAGDLLDEVAERVERWRSLSASLPSLDAVVRLVPVDGDEPVTVPARTWDVAAALDGRTTVREVAQRLGGDGFRTIEAVHDLLHRGLAEVVLADR